MNDIANTGVLRRAMESRVVRQVMALFGSGVLFLFGGILANVLNTRFLDPSSYGSYSFAFSLTEYVILFIDFGLYSSGARVLALGERGPVERRRLIGALILVGAVLSLFAGLLIFVLGFFADTLFHTPIGPFLRMFSVLFGLMGLQALVEAICRGDNRIGALSLYRVAIKGLNVLLIVAAGLAGFYNFTAALLLNLFAYLAASVAILSWARPLFSGLRGSIETLLRDVKRYGWHAYLGNIANTAASKTDSVLISAFADPASVGYYNLGVLVTFPMATFSRSLSTTLFKDFTRQERIPSAVIQANLAWLAGCAVFLITLSRPLVHLLFGARYSAVIPLILPLSLTAVFSGLAQPYNMFLGAKGMGKYLRNTAVVVAVLNLGLNIALIPRFRAVGAAYATLAVLAVNLGLHLYYYSKTLARLRPVPGAQGGGQ